MADDMNTLDATGTVVPMISLSSCAFEKVAGHSSDGDKIQATGSRMTEQHIASPTSAISDQSAHIYPRKALALLRLKCPTVRGYSAVCVGQASVALRSGLNQTLAAFEGGAEDALHACQELHGFDRNLFERDIAIGRSPNMSRYTCAQARTDGASACPADGCILPDGSSSSTPLDLLSWECNLNAVGSAIIAQSLVTSEYGDAIVSVREKLYVYSNGIYCRVDQAELMHKIMMHLGQSRTINQAKDVAAVLVMSHPRRINAIQPDPNFICFKNGTLNVVTRQIEAHDPAHMLRNRIDHDYNPDADCPRFANFLEQTFSGDPDREQKILFTSQWFGYLLTADTRLQKMLIMVGEGANGKSVLEGLMERVLGSSNVHNAMLHRFRQGYVRAELECKLLNISPDLPKTNSVADGEMKAIIAGDPIEVAPKYKASYSIRPYCRLTAATNYLPRTSDTSEGFFRRIIILTFNNIVPPHRRDPHMLDALSEETPGIIAWAVRGLYDLRERGQFTVPDSSERAVGAYRSDIAPVRLFAEECLAPSSDRSGIAARDLFLAFRGWCRDRGFDAGNMISMGRELATLGFISRKSSTTVWLVNTTDEGREYFGPTPITLETLSTNDDLQDRTAA